MNELDPKAIKYGLIAIDSTQEGEMLDVLHFCGYWKQHNLFPLLWRVDGGGFMYDEIEKTIDRTCWNIPKRIITTKYQNETIEIYE